MVDDPDNIVLEHLRAIRADLKDVTRSMAEQTARLASIEEKQGFIFRDIARIDARLDNFG